MLLERAGEVGPVVRWVNMVLLFGLGAHMTYDYVQADRRQSAVDDDEGFEAHPAGISISHKLHSLRIPPMISLPASGIQEVSFVMILAIFALAGSLSGFLGVGGGFLLLPSLIYLIGCPTAVAVGTGLLGVLFLGGYGCFSSALKGRAELVAAMFMLVGAAGGMTLLIGARLLRGLAAERRRAVL